MSDKTLEVLTKTLPLWLTLIGAIATSVTALNQQATHGLKLQEITDQIESLSIKVQRQEPHTRQLEKIEQKLEQVSGRVQGIKVDVEVLKSRSG